MAEPVDDAESTPGIQRMPGKGRRVRYTPAGVEQTPEKAPGGSRPPETPADSTNQAWHDPDDSNDARLKRDKPPHWG